MSRPGTSQRISQHAFLGVSALLFVVSAIVTIVWCASMSAMGMPMPGGWTMSMAWMRMPDQTWLDAAASFLSMWVVMMAAMMLPSLVPMLQRYRIAAAGIGPTTLGWLTAVAGSGYFFAWTVFGLAVFPVGVVLAEVEMRQPALSRAVPFIVGITILAAGVLQFTPWKARQLACCREEPRHAPPLTAGIGSAWRYGLRLGRDCILCCAGLMTILLVAGVMDLRVMAAVTLAITAERVAANGRRAARAVGLVAMAAGVVLIASAALI